MKYARKYVKEISMARKHVKQTNSKKKKNFKTKFPILKINLQTTANKRNNNISKSFLITSSMFRCQIRHDFKC